MFASCSKGIKGRIVDNFNQPLADANISIKNSDFKSLSNSKGEFSLEYAAGTIELDFRKENYISTHKYLKISEQTNYPLGEVKLYKIPPCEGVFFQTENDYLQVPQIKLKVESSSKMENRFMTYQNNYLLPSDEVFTIEIDDLNNIKFYTFGNLYLIPVEVNDKLVGKSRNQGYMSLQTVHLKQIKASKTDISKTLGYYSIKPEYDKVYAFANAKLEQYYSSQISNKAFVFTFKKK